MSFIFTVILIIFFFAILVLGHEFGHFLAARKMGFEVEEFGFGMPPRLFGKKIGKTLYSLNAIPFGGFVKVKGLMPEENTEMPVKPAPAWRRLIVLVSGVFMNFVIGWFAFTAIFLVGSPSAVYVNEVLPDSPALSAGLKAGDKLSDFQSVDEAIDFIRQSGDREISLNILREGNEESFSVTPRLSEEGKAQIGVSLVEDAGYRKEPFFTAIKDGFVRATEFTALIVKAFVRMFSAGDFSSGSGPVGVFKAVAIARDMGAVYFLQLLGIVSLNLMVLNIIPLPALDGGHVLFLAIEKIRRRPLRPETLGIINTASFALLFILMIVVTIKDIMRLF